MGETSPVITIDGLLDKDGKTWSFNVDIVPESLGKINERIVNSKITFEDESTEWYDDLRWYLEKHVEMPFEKQRASQIQAKILFFKQRLFSTVATSPTVESLLGQGVCEFILEIRSQADTAGRKVFAIPWELLEDPPSEEKILFTVRRSVIPIVPLTNDTPHTRNNSGSLRILLVVARSMANDIDHQNISLPLYNTLRDLPTEYQSLIKVKTLRPATIESLEDHLSATGDYYSAIHLDLHGRVVDKKGKARATLSFRSAKRPDAMEEVDAEALASILTKHGIQTVFLNACESARSDANFARDLVQNGVEVVIASAYKLHANLAKRFMKSLYQRLFSRSHSLDSAVRAARTIARDKANQKRSARFHAEVDVEDWFTPVLYHREGLNLDLLKFNVNNSPIPCHNEHGFWNISAETLPNCRGRQLDTLHLEYVLVENSVRTVVLNGFCGSGKTTFMQFLGSWWQATGLFDEYFHIEMGKHLSLTDIYNQILQKVFPQNVASPTTLAALLGEISKSRRRVLFYFDDCCETDEATKEMLEGLVLALDKMNQHVCVLGAPSVSWFRQEIQEISIEYTLGGLGRDAALALAYQIVDERQYSLMPPDWDKFEVLDNLLSLVDRIPLAIKAVIETLAFVNSPQSVLGGDIPRLSLRSACSKILAGHFRITYDTSLLENRLGRMNLAKGSTELLTLSPFISALPSPDAFCDFYGKVFNIDARYINVFEESNEPLENDAIKARYSQLLERLQNHGLVTNSRGGIVHPTRLIAAPQLHPILTCILRREMFDHPKSQEAAMAAVFATHQTEWYCTMLSRAVQDSSALQAFNAFSDSNFRNLISFPLTYLHIPYSNPVRQAVMFFISMREEILDHLSLKVILYGKENERINLQLLWDAIYQQYAILARNLDAVKVLVDRLGFTNPKAELERIHRTTCSAAFMEVKDLSRRGHYRNAKTAMSRLERLAEDISDGDLSVLIMLRIKIHRADIEFGLEPSEQKLSWVIGQLEEADKLAGKYLGEKTVENFEEAAKLGVDHSVHEFLQVSNLKAASKGVLRRFHEANWREFGNEESRARMNELMDEMKKDWEYCQSLANIIGLPTAKTVQHSADWALKCHSAETELAFRKIQRGRLPIAIHRKNVDWKHSRDRAAAQALQARNYELFLEYLLDVLEETLSERPINYVALAGLYEELGSAAQLYNRHRDKLGYFESALSAIEHVQSDQLEHYWEKRMYILWEIAASGYEEKRYVLSLACANKGAALFNSGAVLNSVHTYHPRLFRLAFYFVQGMVPRTRASPRLDDQVADWRAAIDVLLLRYEDDLRARYLGLNGESTGLLYFPDVEDINLSLSNRMQKSFLDFEKELLKKVYDSSSLQFILNEYCYYIKDDSVKSELLELFEAVDQSRGNQRVLLRQVFEDTASWVSKIFVSSSILEPYITAIETLMFDPRISSENCFVCSTGVGRNCKGCRMAWYCSRRCQTEHWPHHKDVCNLYKTSLSFEEQLDEDQSFL